MLLPAEWEAAPFYRLQFPDSQAGRLCSHPLGDGLQSLVYESEDGLGPVLDKVLPSHRIIPDACLMARYVLAESREIATLLAWQAADRLQLFVASEGRLLFANAFQATDDSQRNYHILNVHREFGQPKRLVLAGPTAPVLPIDDRVLTPFFEQVVCLDAFADIHRLLDVYQNASL